ncbi:hypothetical protein JMM61_06625 [Rhodovulum sulfidophilum]|uniref:hypothetical protein n=1 Tax=Rhodovulum sulfidophilum TaxID=35806 RepID=UPI00192878B2|nr:hypothetical protein [Rhodovulum sulfidophilum]MBL3585045.1 hypothetical protein [Rhodovulum sulfidophilum]
MTYISAANARNRDWPAGQLIRMKPDISTFQQICVLAPLQQVIAWPIRPPPGSFRTMSQ